jgi:glycosyltransferase involved in cell wall biosynthesis
MTDQSFDLVLVGEEYKSSPDENLSDTIEKFGLQNSVRLVGRAPDEDIPALNSGASAAVYVSLHEGFGLSPVEAMACATPVIIHNSGAIQEVVADAAILIEQLTIQSVSAAMVEIIQNPEVREEMINKGLSRSRAFCGENSAKAALKLYETICQQTC